MTQSAAEADGDEALRAAGEDNLRDESPPPTAYSPTRPTHNYI
ncbi:hypothetical protein GCWU000325_02646 [Alloprevotella tannerae ATCC 51259]|uniref:Uncharacterized protein n=1 Tax=Alloprevotella tannerae ATCC 51259 TaxID=626522 RepID=C9LK81_9BACT|nr:hypothetical protein GCWU000325_02646 [Alloprevotella tannerae ATCC 51259]